jgi:hypothetical protein
MNNTINMFFEHDFVIFELMNYINVKNLLNTSKLLKNIKKKFIYINLKHSLSYKYCDNEYFRMTIYDSVENPNKQIGLDLNNCYQITDVSEYGNVHTLDLNNCYQITDVSALGNVHTLNLNNCYQITDVNALGNVHTLNLNNCYQITDVNALGNVNTLDLTGCKLL